VAHHLPLPPPEPSCERLGHNTGEHTARNANTENTTQWVVEERGEKYSEEEHPSEITPRFSQGHVCWHGSRSYDVLSAAVCFLCWTRECFHAFPARLIFPPFSISQFASRTAQHGVDPDGRSPSCNGGERGFFVLFPAHCTIRRGRFGSVQRVDVHGSRDPSWSMVGSDSAAQ